MTERRRRYISPLIKSLQYRLNPVRRQTLRLRHGPGQGRPMRFPRRAAPDRIGLVVNRVRRCQVPPETGRRFVLPHDPWEFDLQYVPSPLMWQWKGWP